MGGEKKREVLMHRHTLRLLCAIRPIIARIRRKVSVGRRCLSAIPVEPLESRTLLSTATLAGGNGADNFYIRSEPDHVLTDVWVDANPATDAPSYAYDRLDLSSLIINGLNGSPGDDSLTLDFSNGSPLR